MNQSLPVFLSKYFWDIEFSTLDINKNKTYIIERLIEYGDLKAIKWLKNIYSEKDLETIIKTSKKLTKKTANYFSLYYKIKPQNILCLQEDFWNKHKKIWSH